MLDREWKRRKRKFRELIKGWAFCDRDSLANKIKDGTEALKTLNLKDFKEGKIVMDEIQKYHDRMG